MRQAGDVCYAEVFRDSNGNIFFCSKKFSKHCSFLEFYFSTCTDFEIWRSSFLQFSLLRWIGYTLVALRSIWAIFFPRVVYMLEKIYFPQSFLFHVFFLLLTWFPLSILYRPLFLYLTSYRKSCTDTDMDTNRVMVLEMDTSFFKTPNMTMVGYNIH